MDIVEVRDYAISLFEATESMPFGDDYLVFKVEGKMFMAVPLNTSLDECYISVKCDPEQALELRDNYEAVSAAYHFNKKHWNSILLESDMSDNEIKKWICHSYEQVIAKLPKAIRQKYNIGVI